MMKNSLLASSENSKAVRLWNIEKNMPMYCNRKQVKYPLFDFCVILKNGTKLVMIANTPLYCILVTIQWGVCCMKTQNHKSAWVCAQWEKIIAFVYTLPSFLRKSSAQTNAKNLLGEPKPLDRKSRLRSM